MEPPSEQIARVTSRSEGTSTSGVLQNLPAFGLDDQVALLLAPLDLQHAGLVAVLVALRGRQVEDALLPRDARPDERRVVDDLDALDEDVVAAPLGQLVARFGVRRDVRHVAQADDGLATEDVGRNGRHQGLLKRRVPGLRREVGAVHADDELLRDAVAKRPADLEPDPGGQAP